MWLSNRSSEKAPKPRRLSGPGDGAAGGVWGLLSMSATILPPLLDDMAGNRIAMAGLRPVHLFKFGHHACNQIFRVNNRLGDDLNIHGRFARLAHALAIDAMLSNQDQCVSQDVESNGEPSARHTHHEFMFFDFVTALNHY